MASDGAAAARPRTTGEILDDAWRLYLADVPALLLLSGTFLAPAFAAFLLVLARPSPPGAAGRWLAPAGVAALAALTGLGSGACQEFFRRRSEGRPAGVVSCLAASLRRGPEHVAVRAAVLGGCLLGAFGFVPWLAGAAPVQATFAAVAGGGYLLLPGAVLWAATAPAHAALAGPGRRAGLFREAGRAARLDAAKSMAVILSRVPALALAFLNLHLLVRVGLWAGTDLGGLDLALASAELSLGDPVYDIALLLLCWILLAPYFEASNFLLYLDARTRQEGLDLLQRVRRAFPPAGKAGAALLAVVAALCTAGPARGSGDWPAAVRAARAEVDAVSAEVTAADPYPGGDRWEPRLRSAVRRLTRAADGSRERRAAARLGQALADFSRLDRAGALRTLAEVRQLLELTEEALPPPDAAPAEVRKRPGKEEIKRLVRHRDAEDAEAKPDEAKPRPREEPKRRAVEREVPGPAEGPGAGPGGAVELPAGAGTVGGVLLLGLLLAVLGVAAARFWTTLPKTPAKPKPVPAELPPVPDTPRPDEQPAPVLWRQAEELARAGRHREAVRALYLAVLSHLHALRLLRYEPTRTNGEYVRQVRLAPQAPPGLAGPFEGLTRRFEAVWYGGGSADAPDFVACRELAEEIRALARA